MNYFVEYILFLQGKPYLPDIIDGWLYMWAILPGTSLIVILWVLHARPTYFKQSLIVMSLLTIIYEILIYAFPNENIMNEAPPGELPHTIVTGPALFIELLAMLIVFVVLFDVFMKSRSFKDEPTLKRKIDLFFLGVLIGILTVIVDSLIAVGYAWILAINRLIYTLGYLLLFFSFSHQNGYFHPRNESNKEKIISMFIFLILKKEEIFRECYVYNTYYFLRCE